MSWYKVSTRAISLPPNAEKIIVSNLEKTVEALRKISKDKSIKSIEIVPPFAIHDFSGQQRIIGINAARAKKNQAESLAEIRMIGGTFAIIDVFPSKLEQSFKTTKDNQTFYNYVYTAIYHEMVHAYDPAAWRESSSEQEMTPYQYATSEHEINAYTSEMFSIFNIDLKILKQKNNAKLYQKYLNEIIKNIELWLRSPRLENIPYPLNKNFVKVISKKPTEFKKFLARVYSKTTEIKDFIDKEINKQVAYELV